MVELSIELSKLCLKMSLDFTKYKSLNGKYWMKKKRQETLFATFTVCQITDGSLQFHRIESIFISSIEWWVTDHRKSRATVTRSNLLFWLFHSSVLVHRLLCHLIRLSFSVIAFSRRDRYAIIVESRINDVINSNTNETHISLVHALRKLWNANLEQVLMIDTSNVYFSIFNLIFFLWTSFFFFLDRLELYD